MNQTITIQNAAITFAAFMVGLSLLTKSVEPVRLSDTTFVLKYVNGATVCDVIMRKCWGLDTSTGTFPKLPEPVK